MRARSAAARAGSRMAATPRVPSTSSSSATHTEAPPRKLGWREVGASERLGDDDLAIGLDEELAEAEAQVVRESGPEGAFGLDARADQGGEDTSPGEPRSPPPRLPARAPTAARYFVAPAAVLFGLSAGFR